MQNTKYWKNRKDCGEDYWNSREHSHRKLVVDAIQELMPAHSLLEVGCNSGPNLKRVSKVYPKMELAGMDVNKEAIELGRVCIPNIDLQVGDIRDDLVKFENKSFDVVLSDAVLIYTKPKNIEDIAKHFVRIAKKGIVLIEYFSDSVLGEIKNSHWARDYSQIFTTIGAKEVKKKKIPFKDWEDSAWSSIGYVFIIRL